MSAELRDLIDRVDRTLDRVLDGVKHTSEGELTAVRYVGRGRVPSTLIGLLFHIAEHTQRHTGQVVTTARASLAVDDPAADDDGEQGRLLPLAHEGRPGRNDLERGTFREARSGVQREPGPEPAGRQLRADGVSRFHALTLRRAGRRGAGPHGHP